MALPNTQWQANPLLRKPAGLIPTTPTIKPTQGPVQQSAPTPTVAPTPVVTPTRNETLAKAEGLLSELKNATIGETLGTKNTVATPAYESYPTFKELYPDINEKEIARQQRRLFQAEIDAANRVYDDMLAQERLAGQGRLGTGRAIAARGGLLGSDFGEAQRQNIVGQNLSAEAAVQNERAAKIGTILGTMRKAVADEITAKRQARQQGAENYINYLASARERKENNRNLAARAILDAGMDPTQMDEAELTAIGKEAGLSAQEIIMAYQDLKTTQDAAAAKTDLETRKTEAEIAKNKRLVLSEGQTLLDEKGNIVYKAPKTYAPSSSGSGSLSVPVDTKPLVAAGYSASEIENIKDGIAEIGLTELLAQERANGATSAQLKAIENAANVKGTNEEFLTKDYFRQLFGDSALKESAATAGMVTGGEDWIPFNESGDTEAYLTSLEQTVNLYRQAGYTDQEILKMMQ